MRYTTHHGHAQDLPLPDCSIDAIVTDPPYELGFMGKGWDSSGVAYDPATWAESLRVAKPGAHLLAFGGTRTHHRLMVALEDAGWEIRDVLMWLYGSGFPKSLDVSKAIDRKRDDWDQVREVCRWLRAEMEARSVTSKEIAAVFDFDPRMADHWAARDTDSQPSLPTLDQIPQLLEVLGEPEVPAHIAELIWTLNGRKGQPGENWAKRAITGTAGPLWEDWEASAGNDSKPRSGERRDIPATDAARQWEGWGTALKPAYEPIILARKPLTGTVARNVQEYGTGALNIDGSRIGTGGQLRWDKPRDMGYHGGLDHGGAATPNDKGRWPANLILDEEAAAMLDGANPEGPARYFYTAKASRTEREAGLERFSEGRWTDGRKGVADYPKLRDKGGRRNDHPTVKPVDLMRYCCTLITPPGGTILDPFMGSGSTGMAALDAGFQFVGVDLDPHYVALATARIGYRHLVPVEYDAPTPAPTPDRRQLDLFADVEAR
tara:strand:+ start:140 stop:1612 length:1473 start_codon:yes stop_codon:yes gene_type:complete